MVRRERLAAALWPRRRRFQRIVFSPVRPLAVLDRQGLAVSALDTEGDGGRGGECVVDGHARARAAGAVRDEHQLLCAGAGHATRAGGSRGSWRSGGSGGSGGLGGLVGPVAPVGPDAGPVSHRIPSSK